jgi:hypothetical protein
MVATPPDTLPEFTTQESDEELSQCIVNLKKPYRDANHHLPTAKPPNPIQPLEHVLFDPLAEDSTPRVNKEKSAENQAKETTPAMTRKAKKEFPTTLK